MARKLNLGTHRDSDDVLQPEELPTVYPEGSRPIAPWADVVSSEADVAATHTQETVRIGGSNFSHTPDTHEIESEVAHSRVKLGPQAKKGARENYGGGQGAARKDVEN